MKKQMKAIDLHARKLGDEPPLLCTPLMIGRTRERVRPASSTLADLQQQVSALTRELAEPSFEKCFRTLR